MHNKDEQFGTRARLLIIRFSSFGDIVQAMGAPSLFKKRFAAAEVDWLVRADFAGLLKFHPNIDQVISFERSQGLLGLINLSRTLASSRYTHLYDAHNNVRSLIVRSLIWFFSFAMLRLPPRNLTRSKNRIRRWILFQFRKNLLPQPFRGVASFQKPLSKWLGESRISTPQFFIDPVAEQKIKTILIQRPIALVPSAAWEMKRWPVEHWKALVTQMSSEQFVILGGPKDTFCEEIRSVAPERVMNLAGKLSLQESSAVVKESKLVISNDTGLLHVADQLGVPTIALIGPTAFGYPYHQNSEVAEISLWCKPCSKDGRGNCKNKLYKRCLVDLTAASVAQKAQAMILRSAGG